MSTRRYYYFCHACGADTATYELISVCPYCGAHKPTFGLVDEAVNSVNSSGVTDAIELLRKRWTEEHPGRTVGTPGKRGGRLFRRRRRYS